MSSTIRETITQPSLNPQKFSSIRCIDHTNSFITYVSLNNSSQQKLFCEECIQQRDPKAWQALTSNTQTHPHKQAQQTPQSSSNPTTQYIEIKQFLSDLYTFCNLDSFDPERFRPNMINCIEGGNPNDKLRIFIESAARIREDLKNSFLAEFNSLFTTFSQSISASLTAVHKELTEFVSDQIDEVLSRDSLSIKQFKERSSKVVLSSIKAASLSDNRDAFSTATIAIERLHAGKLELAFVKDHAMKAYKNFLADLNTNFLTTTAEAFSKLVENPAKSIRDTHQLAPRNHYNASTSSPNSRIINFAYLNQQPSYLVATTPVSSSATSQFDPPSSRISMLSSTRVPNSMTISQMLQSTTIRQPKTTSSPTKNPTENTTNHEFSQNNANPSASPTRNASVPSQSPSATPYLFSGINSPFMKPANQQQSQQQQPQQPVISAFSGMQNGSPILKQANSSTNIEEVEEEKEDEINENDEINRLNQSPLTRARQQFSRTQSQTFASINGNTNNSHQKSNSLTDATLSSFKLPPNALNNNNQSNNVNQGNQSFQGSSLFSIFSTTMRASSTSQRGSQQSQKSSSFSSLPPDSPDVIKKRQLVLLHPPNSMNQKIRGSSDSNEFERLLQQSQEPQKKQLSESQLSKMSMTATPNGFQPNNRINQVFANKKNTQPVTKPTMSLLQLEQINTSKLGLLQVARQVHTNKQPVVNQGQFSILNKRKLNTIEDESQKQIEFEFVNSSTGIGQKQQMNVKSERTGAVASPVLATLNIRQQIGVDRKTNQSLANQSKNSIQIVS